MGVIFDAFRRGVLKLYKYIEHASSFYNRRIPKRFINGMTILLSEQFKGLYWYEIAINKEILFFRSTEDL